MAKGTDLLPCPEPLCNGQLRLKRTYTGRKFYGCTNFRTRGCPGTLGARPDGSPVGEPADRLTKRARQAACEAFASLWNGGPLTRKQADQWLQSLTGHTDNETKIIWRFNRTQCERLIHLIQIKKKGGTEIVDEVAFLSA